MNSQRTLAAWVLQSHSRWAPFRLHARTHAYTHGLIIIGCVCVGFVLVDNRGILLGGLENLIGQPRLALSTGINDAFSGRRGALVVGALA